MLRASLLVLLVLFIPGAVLGGENLAEFIAAKKVDNNRMFAYRCIETDNVVEVEQRFNQNTKAEEVRFLVNHQYDEWVTKGISPDLYHHLMDKACAKSSTQTLSTAYIRKY